MTITLYNMDGSAPCGQVRLLAKHIGVELNLKNIDFMKREHLEPSYLKVGCASLNLFIIITEQ